MTDSVDSIGRLEDALFEALPFPALVHRRETVVDINEAGRKVLKAPDAAQVTGRPIRDLVHSDGREAGAIRREMLHSQGQRFTGLPVKLVTGTGECLHLRVEAVPFAYDRETLALVLALPQEVSAAGTGAAPTAHAADPDAATGMRAAALQAFPFPLLCVSRRTVVYSNVAASTLLGHSSPAGLDSMPALDVLHPDARAAMEERATILEAAPGPIHDVPLKALARDGSAIRMRCTAFHLTHAGDTVFAFIVTESER